MKKIKFLLYRLKWHLAPYINFKAPVHVDIELTSRCNLKCTFCHQQDRNYELGDMSFDMAKRIIKECAKIGVKSVKFNWRGESTLHDEFFLLLGTAKILGLYVYLNTNLSVDYHDGCLKGIAKYVDVLKVSIDSVIPSIYEHIRKGAKRTRTLANLTKLAEYRKRYKMSPIIISRRTVDNGRMEKDFLFKNYFKTTGYKFKFDIRPAMPRNSKMKKQEDRKRKYCGQPSRRLVIGWDGKVFPCCVSYNEGRNLFLGDYANIDEMWYNITRKKIVETLKQGWGYPIECDSCTSQEAFK